MQLLPFNAEAVRRVPCTAGTYFLFRWREPVCVAMAAGGASLRSELSARLRGDLAPTAATHFAWIATEDPLHAYRLQLAAHALWDLRRAGKLPTQQLGQKIDRDQEHDGRDAFAGDLTEDLQLPELHCLGTLSEHLGHV